MVSGPLQTSMNHSGAVRTERLQETVIPEMTVPPFWHLESLVIVGSLFHRALLLHPAIFGTC